MARTTRSGSVGRESLPLGKRTVWFKYQRHHKEKRKITKLYCLYIPVPSVHLTSNHSESCPLCFHVSTPNSHSSACCMTLVPWLPWQWRTLVHLSVRHSSALHNIQLSGFAEVISGALVIFFSFNFFLTSCSVFYWRLRRGLGNIVFTCRIASISRGMPAAFATRCYQYYRINNINNEASLHITLLNYSSK